MNSPDPTSPIRNPADGRSLSSATTTPTAASGPAAVDQGERLSAVDTLRGFALLGILLLNIVPFAMHGAAYDNPTAVGGDTGPNLIMWYVLHVLAEGKMRGMFSLVFGVSVILFTSRLEGRPDAADLYYRRTLWLLLIGIAHSYLLWAGEILFPYAMCGLCLYPLRRLSARGLAVLGASLLIYCSVCQWANAYSTLRTIEEGKAAVAKADRGEALSEAEQAARGAWDALRQERNPSPEAIAKDIADWRGNPWQVIRARGAVVLWLTSHPFYHKGYVDILAMMILGMALARFGLFDSRRSAADYLKIAVLGYAVGLPLHAWNGWIIVRSHFDPVVQNYASILYQPGRLAITAGHMGFLLALCRTGMLAGLTRRLAAVGQMALSNYMTHSVVCTFLFTGYGLRWYGTFQRYQVLYVVAGLWIFQLLASPWWLARFRFGPVEWCWRSLTYWRRQPMRRPAVLART